MAAHRVIGDLLSSANAFPDTTKHKLDDAVCELSTCKNALKAVFTEAEMAVFTERTGVLEEWFRQEQERLSHTLPAIRRTKGDIAKAVLKVMKT